MKVQIYEHVHPDDVRHSIQAGVDFIGVKPGVDGLSEGEVDFDLCRELYAAAARHPDVFCNALTTATETDVIVGVVQRARPDVLHLSGDIHKTSPVQVAEIRRMISPVKVMAAIPVTDASSVELALSYQGVVDYFLLDTPAPDGDIGATGHMHDLAVSADIVRQARIPVILAGGLNAGNVQEAMLRVGPWGVDSFTHTNEPGSRRKNPGLVKAFAAAARG